MNEDRALSFFEFGRDLGGGAAKRGKESSDGLYPGRKFAGLEAEGPQDFCFPQIIFEG